MTNAQVLNKPVPAANPNLGSTLPWTAVCASDDFNEYFVNFTWEAPPLVDSNNEFILELSDANGNFGNPVELSRVTNKNTDFDFDIQFALPQDAQGDYYRFRVRSTSPALVSEESDSFSMYYLGYDNPILISQDGNGNIPPGGFIQICNGGSITLATHNVAGAGNYNYSWYRSGTPLSEASNEITVNQSGIYFVEIDYGASCSGSANTLSNSIEVTIGSSQGIAINPPSKTTLCPSDVVTLGANISGMGYTYTWYKDGVVVSGPTVEASTYNVDGGTVGFEGDYSVAISGTGICEEESAPVTLSAPGNFTVTRENEPRMILLPGKPVTLSASMDAANPDMQWYKDGVPMSGETNTSLTTSQTGEYYIAVTETAGPCGSSTKISERTTVVEPTAFNVTIAYNGSYANCSNSSVVLEISEIIATENGNTYDVTTELINDLTYQWAKDGVAVPGGTGSTVSLASSNENGDYVLDATLGAFSMASNTLEVALRSGDSITITNNGSQLCDGATIAISTSYDLNGKTFTWTRDGQSVDTSSFEIVATDEGIYQLSVITDDCPIVSNEISIERFDESVIVIDAEEEVIFPEGETRIVTATGGTSYEWYDSQNNLISSTGSVTLEEEGTHILVATVDNCQVSKSLTVTFRDNFQIPNVITANGDGINDLWVIPNTYSRQSDVTVIIYNEVGDELLNQTRYLNNWPASTLGFNKKNQLFYYKIRKNNQTLKQGTITVIR